MKKSFALVLPYLVVQICLFTGIADVSAAEVLHLSFDEGTGTAAADTARMDGTATPNDSVTLENGAHFAPGKYGAALELSATSSPFQYAAFDPESLGDLMVHAPGATFACWLMVPTALWDASSSKDKGDLLFIGLPGDTSKTRFNLQIRSGAAIRVLARCNDDDSSASLQTATGQYGADEWVHIAAVVDYGGRSMTIYTNGQVALKATGISNWGSSPTVCSSVLPANAGVGVNWPAENEAFIGRIDELRFWNEPLADDEVAALVNPTSPTARPLFTEMQFTPQGLILRGIDGPADNAYHVLMGSNVTLPLVFWSSVATGRFDSAGGFAYTNLDQMRAVPRFFALYVGEALPLPTAPSISVQPDDRLAVAGDDVVFRVEADGTAPLAYQWFWNTNTALPDATNALLELTNVQPADTGAYSVLVTNLFGATRSRTALLSVLVPPSITNPPVNLAVSAGEPALFLVEAEGSEPLNYQWYGNAGVELPDATNAVLSFSPSQATDAGDYFVVVSNASGVATSSIVSLTVHSPPMVVAPPPDRTVFAGQDASFSVAVLGDAPLTFQWYFNTNTPIAGATAETMTLTNITAGDAGSYHVVVSNNLGTVVSPAGELTVLSGLPDSAFNLVGFGEGATGSGIVPETDPHYYHVYTPVDLVTALADKQVRVIEIMNDLDLGWNEIPPEARTGAFRENKPPSLHPVLLASGVSLIDIQDKYGLTIFSEHGATIRHAEFNVKRCYNTIIRNLRFDELWEWDEATKGDYDSKDWDFITLGDAGACTNVWIDHCDFTKAYDGVIDIKGGSHHLTISWCRFLGDDGGPDSFVRQQIEALESSGTSHAMYDFLRAHGFSVEDIIEISRSQKKGHLVGVSPDDYSLTLHHTYYLNMQDRMPRLRGGNVHVYNIYVNNTEALAAKRLRDERVAAMSLTDAAKLTGSDPTYKFNVTLNGAISTEGGAVFVEKCNMVDVLYPIRNNQTDPSDPSYTGKIRAEDTIYNLDGVVFRGSSVEPGSPLTPIPAAILPFSFNGFTQLPYTYVPDDPAILPAMLTGSSSAGAGVMTWTRTNWFATSY